MTLVRLPLIEQAKLDPHLPDFPFRLLEVLVDDLDLLEYRRVYHEVYAHKMRRRRQSIGHALTELAARRYLFRGCDDPTASEEAQAARPIWYRLPWSRPPRRALGLSVAHSPPLRVDAPDG